MITPEEPRQFLQNSQIDGDALYLYNQNQL
jgi:hypothetical protein